MKDLKELYNAKEKQIIEETEKRVLGEIKAKGYSTGTFKEMMEEAKTPIVPQEPEYHIPPFIKIGNHTIKIFLDDPLFCSEGNNAFLSTRNNEMKIRGQNTDGRPYADSHIFDWFIHEVIHASDIFLNNSLLSNPEHEDWIERLEVGIAQAIRQIIDHNVQMRLNEYHEQHKKSNKEPVVLSEGDSNVE